MENSKIEALYEKLGGSYEVMIKRLRKDAMILNFLKLFLEDEEFSKLEKAMEAGDDKAAFEASHALKGVSLNMELGNLSRTMVDLVESLRHGRQYNTDDLYNQAKIDYAETVRLIKECIESE